ncbi:MAG: hypothetical protein MUC95_01280 [Spirochaetes bacterium]|jgi:3-deoxy-D-manno-octulosonic-acid transferase|nr:hypothetical protein [Spirochaetota bacterium]
MIYEILIFTASIAARIYSLFDKKTARFFSLRKGEINNIKNYFIKNKKKVLWFHSASAGELEQAKPIIEKIREKNSDYLIAASFFSPSGYDAGRKYEYIHFCFNLPLDYKKNAEVLLDYIKPHMLVYSKYDVWTNLTLEAARRGINSVLISATLPEKSLRHKPPFSFFFRMPYLMLKRIYAISEPDAERFRKITGDSGEIIVAGDTRFDRVKTVIDRKSRKKGEIINKEEGLFYIVAGSTYKSSERILIDAFRILGENNDNTRLILVPHENDPENIGRLEKLVRSSGFVPALYSGAEIPVQLKNNEILIVDAFGILAFLYREADVVFVGGSYKGSVHSVLEPAIFGKPVLTGPHINNSCEAVKLSEIDGLRICADSKELADEIKKLIMDKNLRDKISRTVKDYFDSNTGASELIFDDMNRASLI